MRKIKLQMRISVDGFVAGVDGEEEWDLKSDEKLFQVINELPDSSDTLLIGRKMAEGFITHFEGFATQHPRYLFAKKMVAIPKIIFTKTLNKPFGKNTSLAKGDLDEEIKKLKNKEGKDILVYGGAGFVSSLIARGHVDEFYLLVIPVLINKGIRIFDLLKTRQPLILINVQTFDNGVTLLHYKLDV